jgi:hypothetical protein
LALKVLAVGVVAMSFVGVGVGAVDAIGNGWVLSVLELFILELSVFGFGGVSVRCWRGQCFSCQ